MTAPVLCRCGRPLRDPVSRARGLGPVCQRRLNGTPPTIPTPHTEPGPGQTALELRPMQPTLWSL